MDNLVASYRSNFRDHIDKAPLVRLGAEEGDARLLRPHQVRRTLADASVKEGKPDLLAAEPPGQGFSHVGRSKLDRFAKQRGVFQHRVRRMYSK